MEEDAGAADRGAWAGSWVCQDDIDWLYRTRRIPVGVVARLPSSSPPHPIRVSSLFSYPISNGDLVFR